ncbi:MULTISPECIES: hypothetical protein [unclassified Massilia]|uniref:hypothetical protein n=1 Tax=unclassified Massilia TaxID=2609279 RepID=UPI00178432E7|nr:MULTISPECIES: hypothetical protein [unclassified Massilia]MBD8529210.1 hypothetical protein [Massilia sp. CFBP 13647]MBD8672604.1 hypothetical protein [Massilia sp. CFBP 13721]
MIITASDCWDLAKKQHSIYFDKNVKARLNLHKRALTKAVHNFLVANHDLIRDGQEADFRTIQANLEKIIILLAPATQSKIKKKLQRIYDYSIFQKKNVKGWGAYELCRNLLVETCPYCNLAFAHTVFVKNVPKTRPTLDHFFDKANFPVFAISLGNLVPSCYSCNSSLKGTKDFFANPHLNPLTSTEKIVISLDVNILKARFNHILFDSAAIKLDFDAKDLRAINSEKTFCLEQRYQKVVEDARLIAKGIASFTSTPLPNTQDFERLNWLRRGVSINNYRNKIMGKMIMDLTQTYLVP